MSISAATAQAICDNIAKSLVDLEAAFITNTQSNAPTTTTITNGQNAASNSLTSRVAGIGDILSETILATPAYDAANNIVAWMNIANTTFYLQYASFMVAFDTLTNGLNAFLTSNALQVHVEFANAFNYAANNAPALNLGAKRAPIAAANTFIANAVTMGTLAVSGATNSLFTAGSTIDSSLYAPITPILLKNTSGSPTTGTSTNFSITYTNASGNSASTTAALSGSLAAGASLSLGITAFAVTNVTVTAGGASGDQFAFIANPPRTVAY